MLGLVRLLVRHYQKNLARKQGHCGCNFAASNITINRNHGLWYCKGRVLVICNFNYMVDSGASEVGLTVDIGPYYANLPGFYATKVAAYTSTKL